MFSPRCLTSIGQHCQRKRLGGSGTTVTNPSLTSRRCWVGMILGSPKVNISRWLKPRSRAALRHDLSEAVARLGIKQPPEDPYTSLDAAVAKFVLLPIEKRLPQWTFGAISARQYTDLGRKLMRKVITE